MTAAVALGFQSCSDWDDHYGVSTYQEKGDQTLWQQISSDPNLSNFATLLQKVGYDEALDGNQSYTVWAPKNGTYDFDTYNAMSDSLLKAEFLNNHIARGYHRATGEVDERIHLLNKKVMEMTGNGEYTFGGIAMDSLNILGKNGMMHYLDTYMDFRPNFYELFLRNSNTTTLAKLFKENMKEELDKTNSIEGPMKDGDITYLDSVMTETNDLFDNLNAKLTTEDSTYTMIVPTDKAWKAAYEKVASYYKYPTSIQSFTYEEPEKSTDKPFQAGSTKTIDADSLQKYYTTHALLEPLVYSHTVNGVFQRGNKPVAALDSIRSTTGDVICNTLDYQGNKRFVNDATDLFEGAEMQVVSNGHAWLTDSLRFRPWDSWCPLIHLRAQNGTYQSRVVNVSLAQNVTVSDDKKNPNVSGSMHATAYYQIVSNAGSVPEVYFYVPEMWSTSYAVYLTMVPPNITDEEAEVTSQKLQIRSVQNRPSGLAPTTSSSGDITPTALKKDFGSSSNLTNVTFDYGTSEAPKIQSKFMGVFTPNFCYRHLDNETDPVAYPLFQVRSADRAVKGQSTQFRIAGITLVPMDAVKYFQEKKMLSGESGEEYNDEMPEIFWDLNTYTY